MGCSGQSSRGQFQIGKASLCYDGGTIHRANHTDRIVCATNPSLALPAPGTARLVRPEPCRGAEGSLPNGSLVTESPWRLIATPTDSEIVTTFSKHADIAFSNRDSEQSRPDAAVYLSTGRAGVNLSRTEPCTEWCRAELRGPLRKRRHGAPYRSRLPARFVEGLFTCARFVFVGNWMGRSATADGPKAPFPIPFICFIQCY